MINTELLYRKIKESGLSENYIAKSLNVTDKHLSEKINNVSEFMTSEVQTLCVMLNIVHIEERNDIFFAKRVD